MLTKQVKNCFILEFENEIQFSYASPNPPKIGLLRASLRKNRYRSGTVNSKWFVGKVLLRNK